MGQEGSDSFRDSVHTSLLRKETEELIEIWKKNDREEWTDIAFEAIEEILLERLGAVPPQGEGIAEQELGTYHDPDVLVRLSVLAKTVAGVVLVASIVIWLTNVVEFATSVAESYMMAGIGYGYVVAYAIRSATTLVAGAFYYVVLRFLSEVAYILMDIEDNTRSGREEHIEEPA